MFWIRDEIETLRLEAVPKPRPHPCTDLMFSKWPNPYKDLQLLAIPKSSPLEQSVHPRINTTWSLTTDSSCSKRIKFTATYCSATSFGACWMSCNEVPVRCRPAVTLSYWGWRGLTTSAGWLHSLWRYCRACHIHSKLSLTLLSEEQQVIIIITVIWRLNANSIKTQ